MPYLHAHRTSCHDGRLHSTLQKRKASRFMALGCQAYTHANVHAETTERSALKILLHISYTPSCTASRVYSGSPFHLLASPRPSISWRGPRPSSTVDCAISGCVLEAEAESDHHERRCLGSGELLLCERAAVPQLRQSVKLRGNRQCCGRRM